MKVYYLSICFLCEEGTAVLVAIDTCQAQSVQTVKTLTDFSLIKVEQILSASSPKQKKIKSSFGVLNKITN